MGSKKIPAQSISKSDIKIIRECKWRKALENRRNHHIQKAYYAIETDFPDGRVANRKELRKVCEHFVEAARQCFRDCYMLFFEHMGNDEPLPPSAKQTIQNEMDKCREMARGWFLQFIKAQSDHIIRECVARVKVSADRKQIESLVPEPNFAAPFNHAYNNAVVEFQAEAGKRDILRMLKQSKTTEETKGQKGKACKAWSPIRSLSPEAKRKITLTMLDNSIRAEVGDYKIKATYKDLGLSKATAQVEILATLASYGKWVSDAQRENRRETGKATNRVKALNATLKLHLGCNEDFVIRHDGDKCYRPRSGFQVKHKITSRTKFYEDCAFEEEEDDSAYLEEMANARYATPTNTSHNDKWE